MVPIHIRYDDRFDGVLLMHEFAFHLDNDKEGKTNKDENGEPKDVSGEPKSCVKGKIKDGGGEPKDESGEPKTCVKGKIMNGLVPYFGVQVLANLLLFSPQPDMSLGKLVCL